MTPKVNSLELAEVLETAGPKISAFTSTLDSISNDIRAIDKWLLESGVRFEIEVPFEREDDVILMWSGGEDGKNWRVYFSKMTRVWDESGHVWEEMDREVRPLIETPVRIRLAATEPLARLVREIASLIPSERVTAPSMPPNLG